MFEIHFDVVSWAQFHSKDWRSCEAMREYLKGISKLLFYGADKPNILKVNEYRAIDGNAANAVIRPAS